LKFRNPSSDFFTVLKDRVYNYFREKNKKPTGNVTLYTKAVVLLTLLISGYVLLVFFTPASAWISLSIAAMMGLLMGAIGFNVMHDGAHGSYSGNKTVNAVMASTLNLLGGSTFMWKQKHNMAHHTFTNVEGADDDIDIKPFIRVSPDQKHYWFHRFQHYYGFFLYGFTYLFWVFYNDFNKYFLRRISDNAPLKKMNIREHIGFWLTKIVYLFTFIILPSLQVGFWYAMAGYGVAVFVCGFVIALVFQLAHIHQEAEFPTPNPETDQIENDWAIHQLHTTANFATRNMFLSWLLGGLNFQVDHHLFPKISHIHYPAISKIIKETCQEYNISYKEFPTLFSAIRSHLLYLKKAGMA